MRLTHAILTPFALSAALLAGLAVGTGPARAESGTRDTRVGLAIAEQGNQALQQIRSELCDVLHDQRPRIEAVTEQLSLSPAQSATPLNTSSPGAAGV